MDDLRERIIFEAGKLFYTYGFKRISMDEIASKSKISKKTLYAAFSSKNEIMKIFLERKVDKFADEVTALFDAELPLEDTFREYIGMFRKLSFSISNPMFSDMKYMPEMFDIVDKKRRKMLLKYKVILEKAKEEGIINSDLNTDVFVEILMNTVSSTITPAKLVELNISPGDLIGQIITIFFFGVFRKGRETFDE